MERQSKASKSSFSGESNKPLCSFEDNSDYVMDVRWSPTNPALFAAGDCRGRLDLWHLIKDTELPSATVNLPDDTSINKLLWLQSGNQLAVGDDQGRVFLYDVNEQLATPKSNDWNQFAKVLDDVKQNQLEAEELMQAMSLSNTPIH
uniref:Uncharacterized protein n=1 Tax=Romanomermis culicivorax TaxID=13658 RepID=A0A915IGE1_ROMCU